MEQIEKQIDIIAEILANIREQLDKQEGVRLGDGYVIFPDGCILPAYQYAKLERIRAQGNWFPTRAEAEKESRRRAVVQKMRGFANGYRHNWERAEPACGLYYDMVENSLGVERKNYHKGHFLFDIEFSCPEDAQACIDAMGDEIMEVL